MKIECKKQTHLWMKWINSLMWNLNHKITSVSKWVNKWVQSAKLPETNWIQWKQQILGVLSIKTQWKRANKGAKRVYKTNESAQKLFPLLLALNIVVIPEWEIFLRIKHHRKIYSAKALLFSDKQIPGFLRKANQE